MPRVFISHAAADRAIVEQSILPQLKAHGIDYWYSSRDIPSASDWEKVIRQALTSCDWFLVALSGNAIRSDWVQAEVHWALDNRKNRFVSLICADCTPSDLHLKLIRYQHIDFRHSSVESSRRLIESFGHEFLSVQSLLLEYRLGGPGDEDSRDTSQSIVVSETAVIGRAQDCDIVLSSPRVSRHHAIFKVRSHEDQRSLWLSDLMSIDGLSLNGKRLDGPREVQVGDIIRIGNEEIEIAAIDQQ